MKNKIALILLLLFPFVSNSQVVQKFSYQAVLRDANNQILSNQSVKTKFSIRKDSLNGTILYTETHIISTNINGLITLEIGSGVPVMGNMNGINWGEGKYFVENETDPTGGNNYTLSSTTQLLSVPFALYSQKSKTVEIESQALSLSNDTLYLTSGGFVKLPSSLVVLDTVKSYVSLISQNSTGNPTSQVLTNSAGISINWSRNGPGTYLGYISPNVDLNRTTVICGGDLAHRENYAQLTSPGIVVLKTGNDGNNTDNFSRLFFEIQVFP